MNTRHEVDRLKGTVLGTITIQKPITYHETYEVAAWYQDHECKEGTFPIYVGRRFHELFNTMTINACLTSTITANYHAPLWGGSAISAGEDRRGQSAQFTQVWNPLEAILHGCQHTSSCPYHIKWNAEPDVLKAFFDLANAQAKEAAEWAEKQLQSSLEKRNWSMVAYYANAVERDEKRIEYAAKHIAKSMPAVTAA